jgi:hypothetical protein
MEKMSDEQINAMLYFLTEWGTLDRWCEWPKIRPMIQRDYPHLIAALDGLQSAKLTLNAVVASIEGPG